MGTVPVETAPDPCGIFVRDNSLLLLLFLVLAAALPAAERWSVDDIWSWHETMEARISPDGGKLVWVHSSSDRASAKTCAELWEAATLSPKPRRVAAGSCDESLARWSAETTRAALREMERDEGDA